MDFFFFFSFFLNLQPTQPLAFSNPLFQHQQQSRLGGVRTESSGSHQGVPANPPEAVQRVSSDSSLSSEGGGKTTDPTSKPQKSHFTKASSSLAAVGSSDYQSTIAPLKKLSQLSSSSSDDSINEQSVSSVSGSSCSSYSSNFVHSTSASFISPSSSTRASAVMSLLGNSAMNGCSTFPRRHRGQQEQTNSTDAGQSVPLQESGGKPSVSVGTSTPVSHRGAGFHRQMSNPGRGNIVNAHQPPRPFPKRVGITTNQSGHVQQRNFQGLKSTSGFLPAEVENSTQHQTNSNLQLGPVSLAPASRGYSSSTSSSATSSSYSSPASQHRLEGSSQLGSPASFRMKNSSTANTTTTTTSVSYKGVTHKPPTAASTGSAGWQIAHHMERSSSSQETSSSSDSSPQSLVRSTQHSTSSMHESSSAHSISSAPSPSPSQPWGYTPSHSDSNSSVNSLTKMHQRVPAHSDSSSSIGGVNVSRISQTPSDSNSSVGSGNNNNNSSGFLTSSQLDNRGLFHNHPNPTAFNARLSSISDSQINTISLQTNPLPQPPSFLTSKYAVVHPHQANPVGSPRVERATSYHSNPESAKPGSNISRSYTASRSMDLGYLSKQKDDTIKRASTDSTLNQSNDGLSPTGSGPIWPMPRDENIQSGSSAANSTANRRLSPQSTVHMGISSVQRKLQEQERTKQEVSCLSYHFLLHLLSCNRQSGVCSHLLLI